MTILFTKIPVRLTVAACFALGSSVAIAQFAPQQANDAFEGIHRNLRVNGGPETVTITDGKTYTRVTEQEYRKLGYSPEFDRLPTLFVERVPVRVPFPPDDRN